MAIKDNMAQMYTERAKQYSDDYSKAVMWSQDSQYALFGQLVNAFDLNSPRLSLLDLGCGNGELYKYLNFRGYRGEYTGIDITQILLDQATARFPNVEFINQDILTEACVKRYNYVCMSGLFNLNVGQDTEWVKRFVSRAFEFTEDVLTFNAISTYVNYKQPEIFYINPLEMMVFCIENLSPRCTLTHHNFPYHYSIAVYRYTDWRRI